MMGVMAIEAMQPLETKKKGSPAASKLSGDLDPQPLNARVMR
jgi:hypothetical protein